MKNIKIQNPFVFIIFGATGDLMGRKLMPAIYSLCQKSQISDNIFLIGVGRRELSRGQFLEMMEESLKEHISNFDIATWNNLKKGIDYQQGFFEDKLLYNQLVSRLKQFDDTIKACLPRFFYLATPPEHYETILKFLDKSTLAEGCLPASLREALQAGGQGFAQYTRVLIEKPFGKDLITAASLEKLLSSIFSEKQIYRIDHYLGKETVQNLLAFRFANGIFEPTWNDNFIDHVQITLAEETGIGLRGKFYDGVGALRDVVQNHMLQMLALTAMDQPRAFDAQSIRDKRAEVLRSIIPLKDKEIGSHVVRGQYKGYLKEKDVLPDSNTETFVAMRLFLNLKRWKNVPFYLRTGKKLAKNMTEISIHYKKPIVCTGDACLFNEEKVLRNVLSIQIQPDDGISLRLMIKKPGLGMELTPTMMKFKYKEAFPDFDQPDAYQKLLLDAISGDQTLFARTDGISASWSFITHILESWEHEGGALPIYEAGGWGPSAAENLMREDGRSWFI